MSPSKISVVIPMYNASAYVADTLNALINQTFTDWNAYIVDDCSKDNGKSIEIVKRFQSENSNIHLIQLQKGKGSSGARNEALKAADGKYIAFLDSDDIWHCDYLKTMYEHIQNCKTDNAAIFYCGYRRMNDDCSKTILPDYKNEGIKNYSDLLHNCPIFPSVSIIDRSKLKADVFFRENLKSLRDDYLFYLDILSQGFVAIGFDDVLVDYRMHKNSMTSNKFKMIKPQWHVYRDVLKLNMFKSFFYEFCWAFNGIKKYL